MCHKKYTVPNKVARKVVFFQEKWSFASTIHWRRTTSVQVPGYRTACSHFAHRLRFLPNLPRSQPQHKGPWP